MSIGRCHGVETAEIFLPVLSLVSGLSDRRGAFDRLGAGRKSRTRLSMTLACDGTPVWLDRLLYPIRETQNGMSHESFSELGLLADLGPKRKEVLRTIRDLRRYGSVFGDRILDLEAAAYERHRLSRHLVLHDVLAKGAKRQSAAKAIGNSILVLATGECRFKKLHSQAGEPQSLWNGIGLRVVPFLHLFGYSSTTSLRKFHRSSWQETLRYGWVVPASAGRTTIPDYTYRCGELDELLRRALVDRLCGMPNCFDPSSAVRARIEAVVSRQKEERMELLEPLQPLACPAPEIAWQVISALHLISILMTARWQDHENEMVDLGLAIADYLHRCQTHWIRTTFPHDADGMLSVDCQKVLDQLGAKPMSVRDLMRKSRGENRAVFDRRLSELENAGLIVQDGAKWKVPAPDSRKLSELLVGMTHKQTEVPKNG